MNEGSRTTGATPPPASEIPPERTTVRRRYRRSLGGWWWLALVLVPLALAGLTMGLDHTSSSASAEASKSQTPTMPSTTPASTSSSSSAASSAAAAKPFSIARKGTDVTVTAVAATEAAKKDLLDTVRANVPDGTNVVDKVSVAKDSTGLPTAATLGALLAHVKDSTDFALSSDGKKTTLGGTVDSAATETAVSDAAKSAFPQAEVVDKLTAGTKKSPDTTCNVTALEPKADAATAWFASGSTTILPASREGLNAFAEAAAPCAKGDLSVTLTGYTDNTGTDAINSPLSKQRAEAVRQYLASHGVKVEITSEYKGAQDPIASNDTEDGRAKNRRVVAKVK